MKAFKGQQGATAAARQGQTHLGRALACRVRPVRLLALALLTALASTTATAASAAPNTAYVTNAGSESVTPIDLATNTPGGAIKVGKLPLGMAITPDGKTAYVVNVGSNSVTPIDVATNTPGEEIKVGVSPKGIAITPDGKTAYVANESNNSVTPINLETNTPGAEIKVGEEPFGVAITPDGKTAYVTNPGSKSVTPIDLATNTPGEEIEVGKIPIGVAITPNGKTAYVVNEGSNSVTPIEVATDKARAEIPVGTKPKGVAITPDGKTVYVAREGLESVMAIDVATGIVQPEIKVGKPGPGNRPYGIATTPDDRSVYVTNQEGVVPIDVATNTPGAVIKAGKLVLGIAITPPGAPVVATEAASALTQNSAQLNALVNPNAGLIGECRFEYGASASYGSIVSCSPASGFGPGPVVVSAAVTGLAANSEYHFRVSARNQSGNNSGSDHTFRTLPLPTLNAQLQLPALQAPAISAASVTNRRFRVAKQATAVSAAKAPLGTSFRFTLSAAAKLQITITGSASGLRRGNSCVAPSARLRRAHAKRCTRALTLGTLTRASEPAGLDSVAFSGRIGSRPLPAGTYGAALSASNAAGHSQPVKLGFVIVRG
jgi:YVTN family beta-propeller protein